MSSLSFRRVTAINLEVNIERLIDGIIFDMDGVLCDSEPFICEAACRMFEEGHGIKVPPDEFKPFIGIG